ncbi:MAG: FG-GAP repeat protein [Pleomorphochaeta sp.]
MKKNKQNCIFVLLSFILITILSSCPFDDDIDIKKSRVVFDIIDINNNMFVPTTKNLNITKYIVTGVNDRGESFVPQTFYTSKINIVNVNHGFWTINIDGYNSDNEKVETKTINIEIRKDYIELDRVEMEMVEYQGEGDFNLTVNWVDDDIGIERLKLVLNSRFGGDKIFEIDVKDISSIDNIKTINKNISDLHVGTYLVSLDFLPSSNETLLNNLINNTLHIFNDHESLGVIDVDRSVFFNEEKIVIEEINESAVFGFDVSIYGDTFIVGAPSEEENNNGVVYIFKNEVDKWNKIKELTAINNAVNDNFGISVDIYNNTIIIGNNYNNLDNKGYAYIYKYNTDWDYVETLTSNEENDDFAIDVDLSDNIAIVGAPSYQNKSGAAYIYTVEEGIYKEVIKLNPSDLNSNDQFGTTVAINDKFAVVGSPYNDTNGEDAGCIYIYELNGSSWSEIGKIQSEDINKGDMFGNSVDIYDDIIIVGAIHNKNSKNDSVGSAYIFENDGVNWVESFKFQEDDCYDGDEFGTSVSIDGDTIIIGKLSFSEEGESTNAVYVYKREVDGGWKKYCKFTPSEDKYINNDFGDSISINSNNVLVGAPLDSEIEIDSGSAYIYKMEY